MLGLHLPPWVGDRWSRWCNSSSTRPPTAAALTYLRLVTVCHAVCGPQTRLTMKADALSSGRRRRLPFGLLMVAAFVILSLLFQFYTLYRVTNYSSDCNNDKQQSFDDELREISGSRRLGILNNRTRFDLALESPNPPTIYTCGDNSKEYFEVIGGIFDEYKTNGKFLDETPWYDANGVRGLSQVESTDYDLFVTTYQVQCSSDATTWLTNKFKGQVSSVTQYQSSFESLSHMLTLDADSVYLHVWRESELSI